MKLPLMFSGTSGALRGGREKQLIAFDLCSLLSLSHGVHYVGLNDFWCLQKVNRIWGTEDVKMLLLALSCFGAQVSLKF